MGDQLLKATFDGLEVVAFESRLSKEMATLISRLGGVPRVAPSMREAPLDENPAAFVFAEKLFAGQLDAVIFMTGVGARALVEALETRYPREKIVSALGGTTVVARGPKPIKVLRELRVPITITVPEPNTWREILQELDENPRGLALKGSRVAVQEYGVSNPAFLQELKERGAEVLQVPVYRWTLPEDIRPLNAAIEAIVEGRARVVLFTNAAQVDHVMRVASENGLKERLLDAFHSCAVCSVGPTCSEALLLNGVAPDLEPDQKKMGSLVHEAAGRAPELVRLKKSGETKASRNPRPEVLDSAVPAGQVAARTPVSVVPREVPVAGPGQPWADSRFLKACRLEQTDVTPVWLMRQAGRYLKEYRELRARVPFLELCKNPDLVTEVTVSAAKKLGVDAAIIFADLLLIVEPLGFGLEYDKGEGPIVQPVLRESNDVDRMREVDPRESLSYLFDAIRQTRAELDAKTPLIGFGAAPFTLASYLIEGGASKNFRNTKRLMYRDAGAWRALMEHLVRCLTEYANAQIAAGVQALQIFDTWVGCLGPADYREFVLPYTRSLIYGITPGVPIIHFGMGTATLLEEMRDAGGDILGLDFHVELDKAWSLLGEGVGVQGNLDPVALYAEPPYLRSRVQKILDQAQARSGHIFNLGHGVLSDTPEENVIELVKMVHELSVEQKVQLKRRVARMERQRARRPI